MSIEDAALPRNQDEWIQFARNLNNNYVHWDKFKDMQLPVTGRHADLWESITAERNQGYTRQLRLGSLELDWWISNHMEALLHRLDMELAGIGWAPLLEPKRTHRYKINALLDESIASAQLAGASVTRKAAREMLLKKRIPEGKAEQICLNLFRGLEQAYSDFQAPMDEARFLDIHRELTRDTIKLKGIGHYRTNNKIDETAIEDAGHYRIIEAIGLPGLMQGVFKLYNEDKQPYFIHPLIKAGLLHYLVTYIRPFRDGNGRMARLLSQTYLLKHGYWVAAFFAPSQTIFKLKGPYQKSIAQSQSDSNNIGYFLHFYLQSLHMTTRSLSDAVKKVSGQGGSAKPQKISGFNERQTAVLQWIREDSQKVVTIRELRSVYGVSKETARTDLNQLTDQQLLQHYHINKKTYAFIKGPAFDAVLVQLNGD
ncbi:Fic family protein [Niabella terrae]